MDGSMKRGGLGGSFNSDKGSTPSKDSGPFGSAPKDEDSDSEDISGRDALVSAYRDLDPTGGEKKMEKLLHFLSVWKRHCPSEDESQES
jgi:hypothetical protein